ncbi:hypothetical protein ACFXD6_002913 [Listeria monocytogenes]|nr:hypothetical protein [Listeria monocytogenes]
MRTIEDILYDKQSAIFLLAELYETHEKEHEDHKEEAEEVCQVCRQIKRCSALIRKLEQELLQKKAEAQEEEKSNVKDLLKWHYIKYPVNATNLERILHWQKMFSKRMFEELSRMGWTAEEIQRRYDIPDFFFKRWKIKHHLYAAVPLVLRVRTMDDRIFIYKVFHESDLNLLLTLDEIVMKSYDRIEREDWKFVYFWHHGSYHHLEQIIVQSEFGKVGESVYHSEVQLSCKKKVPDQVIFYDGFNHQAVTIFCDGNKVNRLVKGNRLNVQTPLGSLTLFPGEYLVKEMTNRFIKYSANQFAQFFEIVDTMRPMGLVSETSKYNDYTANI